MRENSIGLLRPGSPRTAKRIPMRGALAQVRGENRPTGTHTLIVGVQGVLTMHPWISDRERRNQLDEDVFSLAVKRSRALGLADDGGSLNGVWHHNDAGDDWTQDGTSRELAWLQVAVADIEEPLPLPAGFAVLGDVLDRVGSWRLDGVHSVVPVAGAADARSSLATVWPWFTLADPASTCGVRLRVAVVNPAALSSRADEIVDAANERGHGAVTFRAAEHRSEIEVDALTGRTFTRGMRTGLWLECRAPEWSTEVAAWLCTIVVDALRASDVGRSLAVVVVNLSSRSRS